MERLRESDIKKCPFCGKKAGVDLEEQWHRRGKYWSFRVVCALCWALGPPQKTAHMAIKSWNKPARTK